MNPSALPSHLAPISKLPFELLAAIFKHGVEEEFHTSLTEPPNPFQRPTSFVRRMSQVCRPWRQITWNVPELWAVMPYYESYGRRWIDEFLKFSQSALLDIKLSSGLRSRNFPPSNISALSNHSHRIRTLYGITHSSAPPSDFQMLLQSPMPNLRTLVLHYGYNEWEFGNTSAAAFPELLQGGAPLLTTFVSFRCYADLASPGFSRLRVLEVHDVPAPYPPTVREWLNGLRNMPSLQLLAITQSILLDASKTVVDMPCLRVLRYSGDFMGFGLLGQLRTPRLERFDLSLDCGCPQNALILEGTIERMFYHSLRDWEAQLAEFALGLKLTEGRLVIQTLSLPQFPNKHLRLRVELKWFAHRTIPYDADVVVNSIAGSLQRIRSLATRIELPTSTGNLFPDPIPPHSSVAFGRLFGQLSHIQKWMGYSIKDVYALSPILLNNMSPSGVVFPLLDCFSLRAGPPAWRSDWIKDFLEGRNQLGKPIRVLRTRGGDKFNLGDSTGLCHVENDDQSLEIFREQNETKHISTEFHRYLGGFEY